MGSLRGHVAPGFGFLLIGLWHLFNHIKLHARGPSSYSPRRLWFPALGIKYLELYLIILGASTSVSMELFVGPARHQPLDLDGTIPSTHLHNFEHSLISLSFLTYAALSIVFDRVATHTKAHVRASLGMSQLVGAVAFGQELLLFHLHSTDHVGVEGQYHMLLQILILISLTTTLIGIALPRSFLVNFVRSVSILFQGIWLIVIGFMLWTPQLIPKGCFMNLEEAHYVVRCHTDEALYRAKSLVNIEFSFYVTGVTIFSMCVYLAITKRYGDDNIQYQSLDTESVDDMESQKKIKMSEIN